MPVISNKSHCSSLRAHNKVQRLPGTLTTKQRGAESHEVNLLEGKRLVSICFNSHRPVHHTAAKKRVGLAPGLHGPFRVTI